MNKHTSLELSKKLYEGGCRLESEYVWVRCTKTQEYKIIPWPSSEYFRTKNNYYCMWRDHPENGWHNSYDLLWDICIKYADEFFGEEEKYEQIPIWKCIFDSIKRGEYQEAENDIWEHCKFNPKNR